MVEKGPRCKILWTSQYKKDVKRAKKRNYDMKELYAVVSKLANDETLEDKYRDHALGGNWSEHRELHIKPDWLLIYRKQDNVLILELVRTGTHSDLFEKKNSVQPALTPLIGAFVRTYFFFAFGAGTSGNIASSEPASKTWSQNFSELDTALDL